MDSSEVIVLGAGPSGLAAALDLARAGVEVLVLEAGDEVGGLCRTRRRDEHAYDVGGHIPFVNRDARRAWLDDLLAGELHWVDRPVSCVRGDRITRGRYLDQRPETAPEPGRAGDSAAGLLNARFGSGFVDETMRPYLEKIDGVPLEMIPAERALKLLETQAAPEGFWFPTGGIGALMDAMASAIVAAGGRLLTGTPASEIAVDSGRVASVAVGAEGAERRIRCQDLIVATPAAIGARMLRPDPGPLPPVRMRGVAIVYLEFETASVSDEAWIQVDDPGVAFSRAFEPRNWSAAMAPAGRTVLGLECYCRPADDDPLWGPSDDDLAARCAAEVASLGWIDPEVPWRRLDTIRLPVAYPEFSRDQLPAIGEPRARLLAVDGIHHAPGSAVIEAFEAGEAVSAAIRGLRVAA